MRSSARSPTPAAVPGCARRGTWMRIFGGSPFSTSSHSVGVAINSPSLSRPVMSTITVAGNAAVSLIFRPRLAITPSSASSRRMRFNSARSAFFRPNSRAISRVPTFPACARMKATRASGVGKLLSRFLGTLSAGLADAFLRRRFGRWRWVCDSCLGDHGYGCPRLAEGVRFRLCRGLFRDRLLGWLWRRRLGLSWLFGFNFLGRAFRLAATLRDPLINQRDGFRQRDGVRGLVAWNRGVDAAGRDIGAVASVLDCDAAKGRMIAQRLAGIGAEAAAARSLRNLLCNQRDRTVKPNVEHLVTCLKAGIGFLVAHERAETAETRGDWLAGFGVLADFAGQR